MAGMGNVSLPVGPYSGLTRISSGNGGGYGILQVSSGISVFSILPAGFHGCPGGRSGCSETLFNSGVFYEFGGYFGISYPADRGCRGVRD